LRIIAAQIKSEMENKALKMYHYSKKYGVPPYKLTRWLHQFDTIMVDGYVKPWILDTERNHRVALSLIFSGKSTRPKNPRLTIEQFMDKYNVTASQLKTRWKSLVKEESNGHVLIADIANNRRNAGVK
jgi:hypothetical protein